MTNCPYERRNEQMMKETNRQKTARQTEKSKQKDRQTGISIKVGRILL